MRQYKRILEQRESEERAKAKESSVDEEEIDEPYQAKKQNLFNLLGDEDGNEDGDDVEVEEEVETFKQKKKKKKNKKKGKAPEEQRPVDDDEFLEQEVKRVQEL